MPIISWFNNLVYPISFKFKIVLKYITCTARNTMPPAIVDLLNEGYLNKSIMDAPYTFYDCTTCTVSISNYSRIGLLFLTAIWFKHYKVSFFDFAIKNFGDYIKYDSKNHVPKVNPNKI